MLSKCSHSHCGGGLGGGVLGKKIVGGWFSGRGGGRREPPLPPNRGLILGANGAVQGAEISTGAFRDEV